MRFCANWKHDTLEVKKNIWNGEIQIGRGKSWIAPEGGRVWPVMDSLHVPYTYSHLMFQGWALDQQDIVLTKNECISFN